MKFGAIPVDKALGGIVAHAVRMDGLVLKKGETIGAAQIDALKAAGVSDIVVAQAETGDVGEDDAALRLAKTVAGDHVTVEKPFTGRSNLFADKAGVLMIDTAAIDSINDIDESITVATLEPWRAVVQGEMIGTVKIIPFAVPETLLLKAITAAEEAPVRVAAYRPMRIGVVSTILPGLKPATVAKTLRVMQERVAPAGATLVADLRVPHEPAPLAAAIDEVKHESDIIVVFGASAITDRRDVIPAALEAAGGRIEQLGMPVDPGNLLLVGDIDDNGKRKPVLGAPGCARSPKENGFDWVLQRLLAGLDVKARDIRRMGAGGLLMEIVQRGQPRAIPPSD
ncbi:MULTISPECIES: molybdopterin-binding protein [unclassified Beijerinckia]|uniref:molybdopterin-binding protein n=1 Tax=unclassified Beijerinckia TaxID=2638183 RepID=UPI00089C203E|nr:MULTISPECIES: molybdopterin-binding protein [unclassified Beijerinckia]MDH7799468.1 molybdenum cofactor cytidylyltransferase [Beijerinckia sp. GAS462]SED51528.1 molybdenum cofactor cytidylyltransferase [Beijerinckia sp. 28-YEA-48]